MADIKETMKLILSLEGGYSNHRADRGGLTNNGITYALWCKYYGKSQFNRFMNMDDTDWLHVFMCEFWQFAQGDRINNQSIANAIADFMFNSGRGVIKKIQFLVGVTPDGIVGDRTIDAINNSIQSNLFCNIMLIRRRYYDEIVKNRPSQRVFISGWKNRLAKIKYHE